MSTKAHSDNFRDCRFVINKVPLATRYVFARYVTYDGAVNFKIDRAPTLKRMTTIENVTRHKWREFLESLREEGWGKISDQSDYTYMRGCPPVGVVTTTSAHSCQACLVCPYCHGRRALDLYMRLELALYGSFAPRVKPRTDLDVVTYSFSTTQSYALRAIENDGDWSRLMREFMLQLRLPRQRLFRNIDTLGGFTAFRVDCGKAGGRRYPQLHRGGVLLVPAGAPALLPPQFETDRISAADITKVKLMRALRDICRFPRGWIKHATPEQTLFYLDCMADTRMTSTYGILRHKAVEE